MAVAFEIVDIDQHTVGLKEAHATIARMSHALDDMHGVLASIVEDVHRQTLAQFVSEGAALGDPWAALDPSTVAAKTTAGYGLPDWPLVATGQMMDSATSDSGPYSVGDVAEHEAWLSLDWERDGWNIPALHQTGVPWEIVHRRAYTTRTGEHVSGTSYWWHLPARPFWEATDRLADEGAEKIARWVMFNPLA
ncbi:MAG: hypothetical protein ACRDSS_03100 [Actinocrinis sp.]